jgi:hypothetical protein
MESWAMCLSYMGIETSLFPLNGDLVNALEHTRADVFISCPEYMENTDPSPLIDKGVLIGHIASDKEEIKEPCHFLIDFFLKGSNEKDGRLVHRMKFGSNPLIHYATEMNERYNWFYVGRLPNPKKVVEHKIERAKEWIAPIVKNINKGLLVGSDIQLLGIQMGGFPSDFLWSMDTIPVASVPPFYFNSIVSLNYHQHDQIHQYVDCNERTFIVPACCGFQVCDHPMAMDDMYTREEIVWCDNPSDYFTTVLYFIEHPEDRYPYIARALERTYLEHTWFHSLRKFVGFLDMVLENL